jgi:hypothetical protein
MQQAVQQRRRRRRRQQQQQQPPPMQAGTNHPPQRDEVDDEPERPKTLDENSIRRSIKAWEALKAKRYSSSKSANGK